VFGNKQDAVFDDHSAARGDAFAVKGAGAEAADDGAVIDNGYAFGGNFLAKLSCQERRAAVDGVSVYTFENVFEDGGRDLRVKDDRDLRGLYFARAEAAKRTLGGDLPTCSGD
jgi:hypothetical protein